MMDDFQTGRFWQELDRGLRPFGVTDEMTAGIAVSVLLSENNTT